MDLFKKFIKEKKVNKHFKKTGQGVRLSGDTTTSAGSSSNVPNVSAIDRAAAAQAAINRHKVEQPQVSHSKKKIQMIAQREIEEERKKNEMSAQMQEMDLGSRMTTGVQEFEHSNVISGVYFSCELLGDDVVGTKAEILQELESFLQSQANSNDEGEIPAILMVYSLNKAPVKETAIETICTYLKNVLEHPDEEKYRKIKIANKAFQERVLACKGGRTFLEAVGFRETQIDDDVFLVIDAPDDGRLIAAIENIRNGQAVPVRVARRLQVYSIKEGQRVSAPKLPDDFYNLSAEELKLEQQKKTMQVDKMLTLRTKEMRMRDQQLRSYRYKYTLIRIRVPGNYLVQGIFGCYEPLSCVRAFLAGVLSDQAEAAEFSLRDAAGSPVEEESVCLAEYGLAPAAVLHVDFSPPLECVLSSEALSLAQPLEA